MMTSYILREKLKDLGIQSIVEETNIKEILNINNWNYAASYKVTEMLINDVKIKYPSIKYFIDIHRDSVKKQITTAQINDLSYAKIMFLIGLENPSYQNNLNLATNLNNLLEKHYPGISRGIYKKEGPGVNGIYNQHLSSNVMLIEFGGVDNDIYEVYNSVVAVANVLANYIGANNE
jgi:stage II sporulation protein P